MVSVRPLHTSHKCPLVSPSISSISYSCKPHSVKWWIYNATPGHREIRTSSHNVPLSTLNWKEWNSFGSSIWSFPARWQEAVGYRNEYGGAASHSCIRIEIRMPGRYVTWSVALEDYQRKAMSEKGLWRRSNASFRYDFNGGSGVGSRNSSSGASLQWLSRRYDLSEGKWALRE